MWPYSYDSCDVGTAPNQTVNGLPQAATVNGDPTNGGALSFLPGQRLSRCTCAGESHPGPVHEDGTYVGRSAPEIDIFEAQAGVVCCFDTSSPLGSRFVGIAVKFLRVRSGHRSTNRTNTLILLKM